MLDAYCAGFGARINWAKSELVVTTAEGLAGWRTIALPPRLKITEPTEPVTYLGARLRTAPGGSVMEDVLPKVTQALAPWRPMRPRLTLLGRVVVLNVLALSRLTHVYTTSMFTAADAARLEQVIDGWLWGENTRYGQIRKEYRYLRQTRGGLGVASTDASSRGCMVRLVVRAAAELDRKSAAAQILCHLVTRGLEIGDTSFHTDLRIQFNSPLTLMVERAVRDWRGVPGCRLDLDAVCKAPSFTCNIPGRRALAFPCDSSQRARPITHHILDTLPCDVRDDHVARMDRTVLRRAEFRPTPTLEQPPTGPLPPDHPTSNPRIGPPEERDWRAVLSRRRAFRERAFMFKLAHLAHPVGARVHHALEGQERVRAERINSRFCLNCREREPEPETWVHCFADCPHADIVWQDALNVLSVVKRQFAPQALLLPGDHSPRYPRQLLFDGLFKRLQKGAKRYRDNWLFAFLLIIQVAAAYQIWRNRTAIRFDETLEPSLGRTLGQFRGALISRLRDAARTIPDLNDKINFVQAYWASQLPMPPLRPP